MTRVAEMAAAAVGELVGEHDTRIWRGPPLRRSGAGWPGSLGGHPGGRG
jgi:hypothetical protein